MAGPRAAGGGRDVRGGRAGGRVLPAFLRRGRPVVVAHRGGAALAPECTLAAVEDAVRRGADAVEVDLHRTADGAWVAIHDPTVDRTCDGTGAVRDLPLARLREFDAGYRFSPDGGVTFPWRGRGLRVPTLEEVALASGSLGLSLEVKDEDPSALPGLVARLRDLPVAGRVGAGAFDHEVVLRLRALAPNLATAASRREVRRFTALRRLGLGALHRDGAEVFAVPELGGRWRVVDPGAVRLLHDRGRTVHVWTVNDEASMRRLLGWGVDGLVTDRPDLALRVLGRGPAGGGAEVSPR